MKNNTLQISRREFLKASASAGAFTILPSYRSLGAVSPNERVNVAIIGIGNQGNVNRKGFLKSGLCDVVALCDVDMEGEHTHEARYEHGLTANPPSGWNEGETYRKAKGFTDFRKMFDEMADEIDAVLIATPDHSHFAAAMLAMSLGKHVYVQKPLAHTFGQCERLMDMEKKSGVVTQMGNQGFSGGNYFQFEAYINAGIIKDITRISAFMNNRRRWHGWGASVTAYPSEPFPHEINWDQWIDGAVEHPYSEKLHPQEWRSWYDYGCGCFGDWGPHIFDTCHHFLKLGLPEKVTAVWRDGVNELVYPQGSTIQFDFPAREGMPACEVTWFDGQDNKPSLESEYTDDGQPEVMKQPGKILYSKELVFKGGHHADILQIVPRQKFMDMRQSLPKFSQRNSNHYQNFLLAVKGEEKVRSPFSISGPLTQVFNLGIISQRLGGALEFDRVSRQVTNNPVANALLDPAPRKGWEEFYKL